MSGLKTLNFDSTLSCACVAESKYDDMYLIVQFSPNGKPVYLSYLFHNKGTDYDSLSRCEQRHLAIADAFMYSYLGVPEYAELIPTYQLDTELKSVLRRCNDLYVLSSFDKEKILSYINDNKIKCDCECHCYFAHTDDVPHDTEVLCEATCAVTGDTFPIHCNTDVEYLYQFMSKVMSYDVKLEVLREYYSRKYSYITPKHVLTRVGIIPRIYRGKYGYTTDLLGFDSLYQGSWYGEHTGDNEEYLREHKFACFYNNGGMITVPCFGKFMNPRLLAHSNRKPIYFIEGKCTKPHFLNMCSFEKLVYNHNIEFDFSSLSFDDWFNLTVCMHTLSKCGFLMESSWSENITDMMYRDILHTLRDIYEILTCKPAYGLDCESLCDLLPDSVNSLDWDKYCERAVYFNE